MTRMAEALQAPEVKPARRRLEEIALKAMVRNASSKDAAAREIWETVRKSQTLTLALLEKVKDGPIDWLMRDVQTKASMLHGDMTADKDEPVPGMKPNTRFEIAERHSRNAQIAANIRESTPLRRRAAMVAQAWSQREEAERVEWQREQDALDRKRSEASYKTWLRRNGYEEIDGKPVKITAPFYIQVNHKPFWTVCVNEARGWIDRTEHEARFMELVISGVPDDGRPIEHYRRPDEIDALWKQAEA